jgi:hypothetical protein
MVEPKRCRKVGSGPGSVGAHFSARFDGAGALGVFAALARCGEIETLARSSQGIVRLLTRRGFAH